MVVERAVQQWHRPRRKGAGVRGRGGGGVVLVPNEKP
jgi:hypothetical protein